MHGTIAFRVDWSATIGLGHLQRCLSLIDALAQNGLDGLLITGPQSSANVGLEQAAGVRTCIRLAGGQASTGSPGCVVREVEAPLTVREQLVDAIETVASLRGRETRAVVVDHYGLGAAWESHVQEQLGVPVVAIDGLANRRHTAELLVDPAYVHNDTERWTQLVSPRTRLLRGPQYALIAPRFQKQLAVRTNRDGRIRRLLVSFGGSDPNGLTERTLDALEYLAHEDLSLDVVVGAGHAEPSSVEARCSRLPQATFHHATSKMAELMVAADLAIGSGGITTYERAFLGLPAIVIVTASNQEQQVADIETAGAIHYLGTAAEVAATDIAKALALLVAHPRQVRTMSDRAHQMMGNQTIPGSIRVAGEIRSTIQWTMSYQKPPD